MKLRPPSHEAADNSIENYLDLIGYGLPDYVSEVKNISYRKLFRYYKERYNLPESRFKELILNTLCEQIQWANSTLVQSQVNFLNMLLGNNDDILACSSRLEKAGKDGDLGEMAAEGYMDKENKTGELLVDIVCAFFCVKGEITDGETFRTHDLLAVGQ